MDTKRAAGDGGPFSWEGGMEIRAAVAGDLAAINDIYNHYVATAPCTFDLDPITMEQRTAWFGQFAATGPHRLLVAATGGTVAGWTSSTRVRPKAAYDTTIETTIYLRPEATGRGVGTALYEALFAAVAGEDLRRANAGITLPNPASVALHERFGFRQTGVFSEQGRKLGRYWDVAWFEKPLP